jgi:hypothetical protein
MPREREKLSKKVQYGAFFWLELKEKKIVSSMFCILDKYSID